MARQTDRLWIDEEQIARQALGRVSTAANSLSHHKNFVGVATVTRASFPEYTSTLMNSSLNKLVSCLSKLITDPSHSLRAVGPLPLLALVGILNLFLAAPIQAGKPMPPAAPTTLSASPVSVSQINLT